MIFHTPSLVSHAGYPASVLNYQNLQVPNQHNYLGAPIHTGIPRKHQVRYVAAIIKNKPLILAGSLVGSYGAFAVPDKVAPAQFKTKDFFCRGKNTKFYYFIFRGSVIKIFY
jgi:hypothetical protein